LIIKPIDTIPEIQTIAAVEAETWGMQLEDTVPEHVLTAISNEGGVLLGAFEDDRLIGFTLGWLGTVNPGRKVPAMRQLKLVSHMTGVLPEFQDRRVGFKLKLAQRKWAITQGLDLITWTYDPLESRNGYFNIHLLGCVCDTYYSDYYGELRDQMNAGIPSDRFRVDWWITHIKVTSLLQNIRKQGGSASLIDRLIKQGKVIVNPAQKGSAGILEPVEEINIVDDSGVLVEIPSNYQAIRKNDINLALSWRLHTREIFELYFKNGYQIVDFIYTGQTNPRSYYHLEQNEN
jgi:predicted GNAT superfamily acetyltransferase